MSFKPTVISLFCALAASAQPPMPLSASTVETNEPQTYMLKLEWPSTGETNRVMLDGVQVALTTNASMVVSNVSAPWPKTASVTSGTNYWTLTFSVEHLTRWTGKQEFRSGELLSWEWVAVTLKPGAVLPKTGSGYFRPVIAQGFEIVPWTTGPWAAPQYGGPL